MGIERDDHRMPADLRRIFARAADYCPMPEMNAIKDADREEERAWDGSEISDRTQDVHGASEVIRKRNAGLGTAHPGNRREIQNLTGDRGWLECL